MSREIIVIWEIVLTQELPDTGTGRAGISADAKSRAGSEGGIYHFAKANPGRRASMALQTIGTRLAAIAAGEITSMSRGTRHRSV